jgi:hypothetical protein
MVRSDEITRREPAALRARAAGLDPDMCLEAREETTNVTFDRPASTLLTLNQQGEASSVDQVTE